VSAACGKETSIEIAVTHTLTYSVSSWQRVYVCGKSGSETKADYLSQAVLGVSESFVKHNTQHFGVSLLLRFPSGTKCHLPRTFIFGTADGNCGRCVRSDIYLTFTDLPAQQSLALDPIYSTMPLFSTHPVESGLFLSRHDSRFCCCWPCLAVTITSSEDGHNSRCV
jgi:hypothetical protein